VQELLPTNSHINDVGKASPQERLIANSSIERPRCGLRPLTDRGSRPDARDPVTSPAGDTRPTVLAVDDQPSNLLALEGTLEPLGYRIVRANSGEEALKRLIEHDVVVILMDVHMPGLDGYQTTALIRQREQSRDIPIIFLTAVYNHLEHTHRGYALGGVDYISKPIDSEVLRGKVRALVALYTRGQRAERARGEEAERIKNVFLGAVGHDLRNPLNAILLASKLILHDPDCGSASHRSHAKKIERAGQRMHRIIEDILDLTRDHFAGGIPLSLQATRLGDVCRAVVDEHRLARPDRIVELEVTGEAVGHWDSGRLERVVSNLVGNAVEHSKDGPVQVRVRDEDERVTLNVHNGGPPIEPTTLSNLFEPFRRGNTGSHGLGLGLYIVREIVRAHGGSVDVRSTSSDGTTFIVTLPKASPPDALSVRSSRS
jgi:signal transduction histidine kinase